jgi:Ala-tRNA(Pro) deacylase
MRSPSLDRLLVRTRVPYTTFRHPPAFTAQAKAALSHVSGRSWAKSVVCVADGEPILAIVPAHCLVDLEGLARLADARFVRLAHEAEIRDLYPDCEVGAIFPCSSPSLVRMYMDRQLVGDPELVFDAGTHSDAIRLDAHDFAELAHPVIGNIGRPAP